MSRKPKIDITVYPRFSVGTPVEVLRPNLWAGAMGTVKAVTINGVHRVHIPPKPDTVCPTDTGYHADVNGDELREYI